MDKILIGILEPVSINGQWRQKCIVECPDCSKQREVRYDAYKSAETSCCRTCTNLRRPTKPEEELFDWKAYYHSKVGKLSCLFQQQKARCKEKGWEAPKYSQEELTAWGMESLTYHTLFEQWEASGYLKHLSPSVDRLDDYKTYSLDNIQIVTWQENNDKGRYWQVIGKNTKNSLAVDQLSMDGIFIQRFHSIKEAARVVGTDDSKKLGVCVKESLLRRGIVHLSQYPQEDSSGGTVMYQIPNLLARLE